MHDDPPRLDLAPTRRLAAELAELCGRDNRRLANALAAADARLGQHDKSYGGLKNLSVALSALVLDVDGMDTLRHTTERLFAIVDRVVDWIIASPERRQRLSADYCRLFDYFRKTPGATHWQAISRYDAVVAEDGRIRIIELNTGCPAGFMHAAAFTNTSATALADLGFQEIASGQPATICPHALVDGLIELESAAIAAGHIEPGLAVLLTDENRLTHELDLMLDDFAQRGRTARIAAAEEVAFDGKRATHRGDPISLCYDKFRISIPTSKNHCWRDGFENRYAGFLAAQKAGAIVAVNNLAAQTIAEDKSLLAALTLPEAAAVLSTADREFIAENVLWTARLEDGRILRQGQEIDLLPFVAANKAEFVIKPTSEGRGFGVVIGRECPTDEWQALCQADPTTPRVVQDYVEPAKLSVVCSNESGLASREMYLTLGLATVHGRYEGVLSRISPSRITNVARQGFVQAVLTSP
jgi:hypothetical protein